MALIEAARRHATLWDPKVEKKMKMGPLWGRHSHVKCESRLGNTNANHWQGISARTCGTIADEARARRARGRVSAICGGWLERRGHLSFANSVDETGAEAN